MTIDRIFVAFMVLCGLAVGSVLVVFPESREARVPPYFWVIAAMAAFEGLVFFRNRGTPCTMIAMEARIAGFALAIALMLGIPYLAGVPLSRLFS